MVKQWRNWTLCSARGSIQRPAAGKSLKKLNSEQPCDTVVLLGTRDGNSTDIGMPWSQQPRGDSTQMQTRCAPSAQETLLSHNGVEHLHQQARTVKMPHATHRTVPQSPRGRGPCKMVGAGEAVV